MKPIPYGRQFIDNKDIKLITKSLSNDLITTGPFVKKFEKNLKKYLNCKYSYVCNSGTSAIHLALLSLGLKENDTILMPAINFIASYNLAKILKLKVYLVDVDEFTGQITPEKILECIKKNKIKKIHVLITMYYGGIPENIENFFNLKKKFNFFLIEDACHALGSKYKYKNKIYNIGSCKHSDISTFSLHPLKTITTGEGGVVATNNNKFAKKIELFRSHGIVKNKKYYWKYDVYEHGFNYRISDINCALGLSQLNKINFIIKKRENISNIYIDSFKDFNKDLLVPNYSKFIYPSFHLFFLNIKFSKLKKNKDHFINYLVKNKILPQQHYIPISKFKIYKEKQKFFSGAEKFFRNTISIPIYVDLDKSKQMKIINIIKNYFFIN